MMYDHEIILRASPARRAFAVFVLVALAVLLMALGMKARTPFVPWGLALLIGLQAYMLWRATQGGLRLSDQGVETLDGELVAPLDQIRAVERGAFAFKPSNGFLLRMTDKQPRRWAPGLWWRFGRSIGVGGVTSAGASKMMAEEIAMRITSRG